MYARMCAVSPIFLESFGSAVQMWQSSCLYSGSGMLLSVHDAVYLYVRSKLKHSLQVVVCCASANIFAVYV